MHSFAARPTKAVRADLISRGASRSAGLTWRHAAEQHVVLWRERIAAGER